MSSRPRRPEPPSTDPPTPDEERLAQALLYRLGPGGGPVTLKIHTNTYGAPEDRVFDVGHGLCSEIEE